VRQLTEEQVEALKGSADHYVKNADWFKEALKAVDDSDDDDREGAGGFMPSKL
jgi:hypothetical protein